VQALDKYSVDSENQPLTGKVKAHPRGVGPTAGHSLQRLTILGSTGSIGRSTLAVVALHPSDYEVFALTANRDQRMLEQQCLVYKPRFAVLSDGQAATELQVKLAAAGLATEVLSGKAALNIVASHAAVDTVMAAIVGAAGLESSLAAANAGKKILLANKESLVVAGALFMRAVKKSGATLLPIDSEHNAIFQCLDNRTRIQAGVSSVNAQESLLQESLSLKEQGVRKLLLTGSGGPFRALDMDDFSSITPEQACAHPNWVMGRKISVDSATMMNKGLELIEACWLFNCQASDVDIVIHPQSIIHSMVEYVDGSVLAQLGVPDMRTPIAHALAWPRRIESNVERLDWTSMSQLTFEQPDMRRFPALGIARQIADDSGTAAIVLNAANEVAVQAFLDGQISFPAIVKIVEQTLEKIPSTEPESLLHIQAVDQQARQLAAGMIE